MNNRNDDWQERNDLSEESRFIGITIEALLRPCEIYPVRTQCGNGYVWEWAAMAEESKSGRSFDMFFDCLEDARHHGFEPHFLDHQQDISLVPVTPPAQ